MYTPFFLCFFKTTFKKTFKNGVGVEMAQRLSMLTALVEARVEFPTSTGQLTTICNSILGAYIMSSSGLHWHQAGTWCPHMQTGKIPVHLRRISRSLNFITVSV